MAQASVDKALAALKKALKDGADPAVIASLAKAVGIPVEDATSADLNLLRGVSSGGVKKPAKRKPGGTKKNIVKKKTEEIGYFNSL